MLVAVMKAQVRNVRCLAPPLLAGRGLWAARQEVGRYARHAAFSAQAKKASVRIASAPSHHGDGYVPINVLTESDEFWASAKGQVRDQAFVFELDLSENQLVTRVEWKTHNNDEGVAGLLVEAKAGEEWRDVALVASRKSLERQGHDLSVWLQSKLWKVTFTHNHGSTDFISVRGIRFMAVHAPWPLVGTDHCEVMKNGLWSQRAYTDAKVVSGSSSFPVHRAVLAAASPELAAVVKEAEAQQSREILIEDLGAKSVQDWLAYLYTGSISDSADFGVVVLGLTYNITGLVERAGPVALRNVQPETVLESVRMLRKHTDDGRAALLWNLLDQKVREAPDLLPVFMRES